MTILSAPENEEFYYNENVKKVKYHIKDISKDDCSEHFNDVSFVFHLAARSRIQPTIGSPESCFRVNVLGTQRVLEWSKISSVRRVIYSGTSSLYGRQNQLPFNPNMPTHCLNPYSMSKWMGEQTCKLYFQLYGMESIVLRYFNVYGPREPLKGQYAPVVGLFKRQAKEGKRITIVGDGLQKRDFTYINDVVEANICAMNADNIRHNIYNVGTGRNYSIIEVADMIENSVGVEHIDERKAEVRETLADIELTKKHLGWSPIFTLEKMINSY